MAKDKKQPPPSGTADQVVADLLNSIEQRREQQQLPAEERKAQKKKNAELARRITIYISPRLKNKLKKIAKREGVPASQVAHWLLLEAEKLLDAGKLDLDDVPREKSDSPAYDWNLKLKDD